MLLNPTWWPRPQGVTQPRRLAQRPVACGPELGELVVDIDGDGAEQADVVAVRRGDVGEQRPGDRVAGVVSARDPVR